MYVKRIFYPLKTLGPGNRVGIWTMGCNKRCQGCMSKDLQVKDENYKIDIDSLINKIKEYYLKDSSIGVTISGGEPFIQEDLNLLVKGISELGIEDILVYSGYTYNELINMNKNYINESLKYISVLIDGEYVEELNDNKSLRGSSNQRIIFLKESLIDKYMPLINQKREFQVDYNQDKLDFYGIFNKGMEKSIKETFKNNNLEFISSNDIK